MIVLTKDSISVRSCLPFFTGGRFALYGDSNCLDSSHMQRGLAD